MRYKFFPKGYTGMDMYEKQEFEKKPFNKIDNCFDLVLDNEKATRVNNGPWGISLGVLNDGTLTIDVDIRKEDGKVLIHEGDKCLRISRNKAKNNFVVEVD